MYAFNGKNGRTFRAAYDELSDTRAVVMAIEWSDIYKGTKIENENPTHIPTNWPQTTGENA